MLIPFIVTFVLYLVIIVYISTSTSDTTSSLKMNEMAAKTKFSKEKVILNAIELYITANGSMPVDVNTLKSSGYLHSTFENGSFIFSLSSNKTTVLICSNHERDNEVYRNMYLNHYTGKEMGYAPYTPGTTTDVCHPYPLRLKTIELL